MALLKLTADLAAQEQDMFFTYDELIAEVCVGLNSLLIWHGVVPIQGVTGSGGTLDLVDQADDTPLDGMDDTSDMCERAILLRHNAKIAVIKALIEQRVARANRAHKQDTKVTKVGQIVDLYRRPATKDFPGWKGPGVVLEFDGTDGPAIVRWQGRPWLMALRHLRPDEAYCPTAAAGYAASTYVAASATLVGETSLAIDHMIGQLMRLQDKVDGATPGKLQSYGRVYDTRRNQLLRFGTRVPRLPAVAGPSEAMLLVWKRTARMDYIVQTVNTTDSIPLRDVLVGTGWSVTDVSVLMFVRYLDDDDNNRDGADHNDDPAMPDAPMCDPAVDDHHHDDDDVSMTAAGSVSAPPSTIDHDESNIEMPQLEKSTTTYDSDLPPEPEWNDDADLSQAIAASLKQQGDDDQHDSAASSSNHGPVLPLAAVDEISGTGEDTTLLTEPYDDELTR